MKSFDKWWDDCGYKYDFKKPAARDAYVLGRESRQEEVDKLKSEIDELKWMLRNSNGQADEFCKKSIELQKRIDKVADLIEPSDEISHRLYREIIKILKGK